MIAVKTSARALNFSSLPPNCLLLVSSILRQKTLRPPPPLPIFASSYFCN